MPQIVLTEEQARVVSEAVEGVEVFDAAGRFIAFFKPCDAELASHIAIAKSRLGQNGSRVPSAQVRAHLQKLEEISQRENLDEDKVLDLLRRTRAGEEV